MEELSIDSDEYDDEDEYGEDKESVHELGEMTKREI